MNKQLVAEEIADELIVACCIEGIRGETGVWRASKDDARLKQKIARRVKQILDNHTLDQLCDSDAWAPTKKSFAPVDDIPGKRG